MQSFSYTRARSVAEAVAAMRAATDGAYLAGGMSLIPLLKERNGGPGTLIDVGRLDALRAIRRDGADLEIGALATHDAVASSAVVAAAIPGLARLAGGIGDPQVRNRGTLGGALAANEPAADYPAAVLALGASIVTDRRTIAADAFFTGPFATALAPDELLTAVRFPVPGRAAFARFDRGTSRYPLAGVFVALGRDGVRVAITGVGGCVFRAARVEDRLRREFSPRALDGLAVEQLTPDGVSLDSGRLVDDLHGSAAYRGHLALVMARRAVAAALR
jgi:carbon-monoxide dehydrogenase medium subunit